MDTELEPIDVRWDSHGLSRLGFKSILLITTKNDEDNEDENDDGVKIRLKVELAILIISWLVKRVKPVWGELGRISILSNWVNCGTIYWDGKDYGHRGWRKTLRKMLESTYAENGYWKSSGDVKKW